MSRARDNLRKEKMAKRIEAAYADGSLTPDDVKYRKEIKNKIKAGKLPRWSFVRAVDGSLPKKKIKRYVQNQKTKEWAPIMGGLELKQVSTLELLCKKIPLLKESDEG